jgi:outer membrane protein TolC
MKWMDWHVAAAATALLLAITPARAQDQAQTETPAQEQVETAAQGPAQTAAPAQPQGAGRYQVKLLDQNYTKGQPAIPNIFRPYTPIRLPQQAETNAPTLDQMIRDNKLQLSVEDAVALALQNNLDITLQRYVTYGFDAAVLGAKSGPGNVNPFGPFLSFDPILTSTWSWARTSIPVNNGFLSGTGSSASFTALTNQTTVGDFGYSQAFPTGTNFLVSLNSNRQSSTSSANFFNPSVSSALAVQFSQPLLNGFGFTPNLRGLRVARINLKIADFAFQQQVIITVTAVKNQYYELVFAQEDVVVKQKSVELAGKLYNDNKKQVEIGTLAPIEVTRAESQLATTRADLITSQTLALQDEQLLKQLILRNVMDPKVAEISITPTDTPSSNIVVPMLKLQDAVAEATAKRPDVQQAFLDLDAKKIISRASRNALLPSLNLNAQYGAQGLGGNQTPLVAGAPLIAGANPIVTAAGAPALIGPGGTQVFTSSPTFTRGTVIPGGLGDALSNVFQSNFPNYSVSLNLTFPIRNRSAQAANITAMLAQQQSEANVQKVRNAVAVDVHNAQIALEQDKFAVEATNRARILAEQTLDAEQKKFQLGASTIFLVIQAQRDLATARSNEVRSTVNFVEAKVNFDRALGRTLEENRIDIAGAKPQNLQRVPLIPGTAPGEAAGEPGKY